MKNLRISLLLVLGVTLSLSGCTYKTVTVKQIGAPKGIRITSADTITAKFNIDSDQFSNFKSLSNDNKINYTLYYFQNSTFLKKNGLRKLDDYEKVKVSNERWPRVIFTFDNGKQMKFIYGGMRGNDKW